MMLLSESVASRRSSGLNVMKSGRSKKSMTIPQSPNLGHSVDSRVLIDMGSPNFKTKEQRQQDEIINSLRNNYLNENIPSRRSESVSTQNSKPTDDTSGSETGSIIPEHDPNLESEGGDITRDLYRLSSASQADKSSKIKSMDDLDMRFHHHRPGSTASALNVPGGFRREFIVKKLRKDKDSSGQGTKSSAVSEANSGRSDPDDMDKVPFLTRNFLEFLYVYGHFAGESFEDDFVTDDDVSTSKNVDETSPLLARDDLEAGRKRSAPRSAKGTTSTSKAFLLMIKSFIGTGVLFLPNAFSNGGLAFSLVMLLCFGLYSYWCYYILIQSKIATKVSSFGDIGLSLYGPWMKFIILFSLVLTQLGFSGAYVVFTAKNLLAFIANVFHWHDVSIVHILALELVIFIPLSFIRNISKLSFPSLMANFFIMAGILIVVFFTAKHLFIDLYSTPAEGVIMSFNSQRWSLFIGTAIFAFEGIGLIIPVQDSMKHPEKFPMVLGLVIITATVLFTTVATLGYLSYGSKIQTVILLNLPQENICVNLIQFFYSLAILLSTPLQLFPAIAIIENKVFPKFTKIYVKHKDRTNVRYKRNSGKLDWKIKWLKNSIRSIIVFCVVMAAYFGADHLDKFVSIVGSFACIPLVYIYPPMLHLESCSKPQCADSNRLWNRWPVGLDYFLICFGIIAMSYTSYQCIFG